MAITAPVTSLIAVDAASRRRPSVMLVDVALDVLDHDDRIVDDEAGGERDAEERQGVDREAEQLTNAKVPISDTGMVIAGISVVRQFWRNRNMTMMTSAIASSSVVTTSRIDSETTGVVSNASSTFNPGRVALATADRARR